MPPMKKIFALLLFNLFFYPPAFADSFYFKNCKLSNVVSADYIIDFKKKVINVNLLAIDGKAQYFEDKIKLIEKDKIISEKIKSSKGEKIYYQYFLDAKTKTVIKLQFQKQGNEDMNLFKLLEKKVSKCQDIKSDWDKLKMDKAEISKEQKQVLEAQQKIREEQSSISKCIGNDYSIWTNCKGSFVSEDGHKYSGQFLDGKILKGISIFPGGAKYVGDFLNFKPHGYGTFAWTNGDRYFGEWKNGKVSGTGTKSWKDGREYSGEFMNDKLHGNGTLYYPDGKKYVGEFINGNRHGEGTITFPDGTAYMGKFLAGKEDGLGECINIDGSSIPCKSTTDTQAKNFTGKNTHNISIVAKKWVRISQYENNSKRGKKVMDKLKIDFKTEATNVCSSKGNYKVLDKKIEVLEIDETPAYGLETVLKLGITGVVECI